MPGFRQLAENLGELRGLPSRITRPVANEINDSIQRQFDQGLDPYGNPWAPLLPQTVKRKGGDARILIRTEALQNQTVAVPLAGAGIEISSLEYGEYHQGGTGHMVARPILPDGDDLPEEWTDAIEEATDAEFERALT